MTEVNVRYFSKDIPIMVMVDNQYLFYINETHEPVPEFIKLVRASVPRWDLFYNRIKVQLE